MAGVVAASKHRSGPRGRFAYMTISDPFGIFEAMIFDEALITSARDILADGSVISLECLVKKDEGGVRILIREVTKLEEFLATTKAQDKDFEDIKKQPARNYNRNNSGNNNYSGNSSGASNFVRRPAPESVSTNKEVDAAPAKKPLSKVDIIIKTRDPIFDVKSFLSQCLAPADAQKFSTVIFSIAGDKKIIKVELPQKYLLDESDLSRLRRIEKIIDVESVL